MAGPKSKRARRVRRRGRKRGSVSSKLSTSIPSRGLSRYPVMRSFSMYPVQVTEIASPSWLEYLKTFGAIAMKIFSTLVSGDKDVQTSTWAITGAVQALALGPEDMVWSSPIREDRLVSCKVYRDIGVVSKTAPAVDYRQGKIDVLRVRLSCGSELAKRAGRYVIAIKALTYDEAVDYREGKIDIPTFSEVSLMPGATTAHYGTPLLKTWHPNRTDFGSMFQRVGQLDTPGDANPPGGFPVCVIYVGYQDFASSSPSPSLLYAPEEAMINVDVSGTVHLREWGATWIRKWPMIGPTGSVTCCIGNSRYEVPTDGFTVINGLPTLPNSKCPEDMLKHLSIPDATSSRILKTEFVELEDGEIPSPSASFEKLEL